MTRALQDSPARGDEACSWSQVVARSGPAFGEILYVPGLLPQVSSHLAALCDSLRRATAAGRTRDPRIRVYRDSMLDYRSIERALSTPWTGRDLHQWFRDLAGGGDICVAYNECDQWSPQLADMLNRNVIAPLMQELGDLGTTLEWYSFIGETGWTPFGVHQDPEVSMIFHLGPSPKEVWIWDQKTLPHLPGHRPLSYDFESLLPSATQHITLQTGDFLSIPAHHFHVFRNVGFAAFLGLMVYPQDHLKVAAETLLDLLDTPELRGGDWLEGTEQADAIANVLAEVVQPDKFSAAITTLRDRNRLLRSRSFSGRAPERVDLDEWSIVATTKLRAVTGALISDGSREGLFARGRRIRLPACIEPCSLVAALATHRWWSTTELAITLGIHVDEALPVVRALVACGAILLGEEGEVSE